MKNGEAESINVMVPDHKLATEYRYNTLNQVIAQQTPDAGLSKFYYDRLGRLVVSQNAKQLTENKYSYTLYDALGRITEVGQKPQSTAITQAISSDPGNLENWLQSNGTTTPVNNKEQITITKYDLSYYEGDNTLALGSPPLMLQKNLRNRVSYTMVFDEDPESGSSISHKAATYYSYDIHGNVNELVQDINLPGFAYNMVSGNKVLTGNRFSKIEYDYDLISGKVNQVAYKPGNPDAIYHKYVYDAENRLTDVYTSTDKLLWEKDARYSYFKHGPLARTILGQDQVQGLDYAYTLQGWLKGVNTTSVYDGSIDMGNDGYVNGSTLNQVARDVFGFNLNYFDGDYKAIGGTNPFAQKPTTLSGSATGKSLYNGNINSMLVNIPKLGEANLYGYTYDQLNRITSMDLFTGFVNANNNWGTSGPVLSADYKERVAYDPNGNILTYLRNGRNSVNGTAMDDLAYKYDYYDGNVRHTYIPGQTTIPSGARLTNRLNSVTDQAGGTYTEDIKSQNDNNYEYDEIGNLTKDVSEGITNIAWNVYGKIHSITKSSGTITYDYDATGNRISKTANGKTSFYVRDASGNVMGIYEKSNSLNNGDLTLTELHLYGSSRLGIFNRSINVQNIATNTTGIFTFERGNKFFELSNHLGNVLVTVSDKKIAIAKSSPNQAEIDYYTADVITANDYYPGGMQMPGKYSSSSLYRYGFNGKENDNEVKGEGNQQDYGMRIYDPRLVRFLSIDPLAQKYPELTPYQFASNTPIQAVDLDGAESMFGWSIGTPPGKAHEVVQGWQDQHNKITNGTASGVKKSLTKTWSFITSDAWKASTWKNAGLFIEEAIFDMSMVKIAPSPNIDAKAHDFKDNVINGDAYSRSEYFSELGTDIFTGIVADKGISKLSLAAKVWVRTNLAKSWGVAMDYINFERAVSTQTLKVGKTLYQYRIPGTDKGSYFVESLDITPEQVGLKSADYSEVYKVTLTEDAKVLKTTHKKDAPYWRDKSQKTEGGGEQIYNTEIKNTATFDKIK